MAITIDPQTNSVIDLEESVRIFDAIKNLSSDDCLDEAAQTLRMLSNNKTFLVDKVNSELASVTDLQDYQADNFFPQQVVDLGGTNKFRLRANLWPPTDKEFPAEWEKNLFAYQKPHDHDSDFLTVGYWGAGYETDIYEYDPEQVIGYDGEPVHIRFLERTYLTEGKVMFYRANRDIHTQIAPDEFSISLNLLIANPNQGLAGNQYWFDVDQGIKNIIRIVTGLTIVFQL